MTKISAFDQQSSGAGRPRKWSKILEHFNTIIPFCVHFKFSFFWGVGWGVDRGELGSGGQGVLFQFHLFPPHFLTVVSWNWAVAKFMWRSSKSSRVILVSKHEKQLQSNIANIPESWAFYHFCRLWLKLWVCNPSPDSSSIKLDCLHHSLFGWEMWKTNRVHSFISPQLEPIFMLSIER